jgi:hypothetical protein
LAHLLARNCLRYPNRLLVSVQSEFSRQTFSSKSCSRRAQDVSIYWSFGFTGLDKIARNII